MSEKGQLIFESISRWHNSKLKRGYPATPQKAVRVHWGSRVFYLPSIVVRQWRNPQPHSRLILWVSSSTISLHFVGPQNNWLGLGKSNSQQLPISLVAWFYFLTPRKSVSLFSQTKNLLLFFCFSWQPEWKFPTHAADRNQHFRRGQCSKGKHSTFSM